ncbi:MAG: spore maturation protein A [Oscillospiraceae bacterium]
MMKVVFSGLILFSVFIGAITGRMNAVSNAAISGCTRAVELMITLIGSIALWGGLMRIAEKSGLTDKLTMLFRPLLKRLFKGLSPTGGAFQAISMNITANLLGLGNAATPLGILAVKRIAQEEHCLGKASRNMVLFLVLNTASIQLIPATIATLRMQYGAQNPMDVLPAILLSSLGAVTVGIVLAFLTDAYSRRKSAAGTAAAPARTGIPAPDVRGKARRI